MVIQGVQWIQMWTATFLAIMHVLTARYIAVTLPTATKPKSTMRRAPIVSSAIRPGKRRPLQRYHSSRVILGSQCTNTGIALLPASSTPGNSSVPPNRTDSAREFSTLPTPLDENERAIAPINFTTSSMITGEESHILEVKLREGEMLRAESGAMLYM
jgi:hypothetical protein